MRKTLLIVLLISGFCFGQKYELAEDFYSNGLPKAINTYKVSKNKIELIKTVEWRENGQKRWELTYKDGEQIERTLWSYHKNGQKSSEGTYKDGELDGLATGWYENGQKSTETTYKDGEMISSKFWDEYGNLILEECWDEDGNVKECWR